MGRSSDGLSGAAVIASRGSGLLQLLNSSPPAGRILGSLIGASHESNATVRRLRPTLPSTSPSTEAVLLLGYRLPARTPAPLAKAALANRCRLSRQPRASAIRLAFAAQGLLVPLSGCASGICRPQSGTAAQQKPQTTADCKDGRVIHPNTAPVGHLHPAVPDVCRGCKDGRLDRGNHGTTDGPGPISR